MELESRFGRKIKKERQDKGLTITQIAKDLDIDKSLYSKCEKGLRLFPKEKIEQLAKLLANDYKSLLNAYYSDKIVESLKSYPHSLEVIDLVKEDLNNFKNSQLQFKFQEDWRKLNFSKPENTIRLATMFSGIGAIEYALRRLKLNTNIVFASDIDNFVKESYFANYEIEESKWYNNVADIDGRKYKNKIDLLVGGSPCQSFSMVGKRKGLNDTRGTLFYEFARVVDEARPKVFIFENVKGLVNHDKVNTFQTIKAVFDEIGYKYHFQLLNAKNYGIPQHRERIFIVGFRNQKSKFEFPESIPLESSMQDFLEDYTDSKYYLKEKGVKFVTSSKNRKKRYTQINGDIALCQKANQQFNWHGDFVFENRRTPEFDEFIFDVNKVEEKYYLSDKVTRYVLAEGTKNFKTKIETDLKIARPLLQSMHKMHRAGVDNYVTHNKGRIRKLTPKECLRLMGFRDDFQQVVSDTQMYRQAGNSIVVDVLIAILKKMDITKYSTKNEIRNSKNTI